MGLFLLALTIVGAASLRTVIPALRPRSVADPPPKPKEEIRGIPFEGVFGLPTKLSPCPPGTVPRRVSKLFPDGTIRGAIVCMPDPKRAQGESSLRSPFINIAGEKQQLSEPIDLSDLIGPVLL